MLLVLDESGDDGLIVQPGQSPWLVIGGLLFPDQVSALACRAALGEIRKKHGGKEFHFRNNTPARRALVLNGLAASPMTYHAVACDKSQLPPGRWRKPHDLFSDLAAEFITTLADRLQDCTVWFDSLGGRDVDREYGRHLQRSAGQSGTGRGRVKDWKALDSSKELLIQAADYVCGAVARSVKTDGAERQYRSIIRRREGLVWTWPRTELPIEEASAENERGPLERPAFGESSESGASHSEKRPFDNGA